MQLCSSKLHLFPMKISRSIQLRGFGGPWHQIYYTAYASKSSDQGKLSQWSTEVLLSCCRGAMKPGTSIDIMT